MRGLVSYGFLAPPNVLIVSCLVGALIALLWRRIRIAIVLASSLCLYAAANPAFSSYVTQQLETEAPNEADFSKAEAIVVLGADMQFSEAAMPERLGPLSLERLIFV